MHTSGFDPTAPLAQYLQSLSFLPKTAKHLESPIPILIFETYIPRYVPIHAKNYSQLTTPNSSKIPQNSIPSASHHQIQANGRHDYGVTNIGRNSHAWADNPSPWAQLWWSHSCPLIKLPFPKKNDGLYIF